MENTKPGMFPLQQNEDRWPMHVAIPVWIVLGLASWAAVLTATDALGVLTWKEVLGWVF